MLPIWKLIGFILYVILYYTVLDAIDSWPPETITAVIFKLLPLMHLIFIILSTSMDDDYKVKSVNYRVSISFGLIASAVGDCCLTYSVMLPGLCSFGIAQLFYIRAFGIRPLGSGPCAASFAMIAIASYFFLFDVIPLSMMKVACVVYWCLLVTTCWRAAIQMLLTPSLDNVAASIGAHVFLLSDTMFVLSQVHSVQFNQAPFWIMLTYYVAQLGITLSACDTRPAESGLSTKKHI